jgi:hypothetical protein
LRTLASFVFVVMALLAVPCLAAAEGVHPIDLEVREDPTPARMDMSANAPMTSALWAPARPQPLRLELDAAGHLALLLRVQPDLFLGKLALSL